ncbi:glycoside hydrolase family 88 protein [Oceanispirochaeta sp.]|jgi:rhamnogalacturonyl hydrolase YesR|uniref:glycoside hydrolase family 88 protein n=1 Tax=Oceanispirochaeta sp. TaxID=2035350 RepID=UPI002615E68B|nr:glycoside hydrolase family 88 protein [Oceanispirochaeta sp.]MDA3955119.1 glycoside hydrolase family 88 protein [Oceanispirochaeta sp.]
MNIEVNPLIQGGTPGQIPLGGMRAFRIQKGVRVSWEPGNEKALLSLTVACDLRQNCVLTLTSGDWKMQLDASFASHGQKLRIPMGNRISSFVVTAAEGDGELWIALEAPIAPSFCPYSADRNTRLEEAETRLKENALAQFSWMGGCVLNGLSEMHRVYPDQGWKIALTSWASHFIGPEGQLLYQNPRGTEVRNKFINIESTLPVASLAGQPGFEAIGFYARQMWDERTGEDGAVTDGESTAEGCYTIAYPMATLAVREGNKALIDSVLTQLRTRKEKLFRKGKLYLRNKEETLSFENWTRGICWYILGNYRCLSLLGDSYPDDLMNHFKERCSWIISKQRPDGLWDNFLDEEGFPPDSSGSAGIAAALAGAYRKGLLGEEALEAAKRCFDGLCSLLEPDGWLSSVAPNNKRGEKEQHTHLRTVEPFALGLFAQLWAVLDEIE